MTAVYVEITATRGSTPRDAGTAMMVTAHGTDGTIGGGALELRAIETARRMLAQESEDREETIPLGPGLGQCCGGAVSLLFTRQQRAVDQIHPVTLADADPATAIPLWVWGAGHVGRAVVRHAAATGAFDITWIDTATERFPEAVPAGVTTLRAAAMPALARRAPASAHHLILTYSHDIDLALCAALLEHKAASIGLIGSDTKWARFSRRLKAMHLDPTAITCPIGDKSLGKHPDAIAQSTVRSLLPISLPIRTSA